MMIAVIVVGTMAWMTVFGQLQAIDGSQGVSLVDARVGMWRAGLVLFLLGVPAILGGLYVSAAGNPMSGLFTTAFCLLILAGRGGAIEGVMHRQASGGGLYVQLGMELALWALAWCFLMFVIRKFRDTVRGRWVPVRLMTPFSEELTEEETPKFVVAFKPVMAGILCGALGWLGCTYLIQSPSSGQVIGAILLAFTVAGVVARLIIPTGNVVFLILSPLIAGFIAYGQMALTHGGITGTDLIALFQKGELPGPALALPIHWASAGLVGVTTGIGIAQALLRVKLTDQLNEQDQPATADP